ncbi:MAG: hypothetical protein KME45_33450 [Stenomitos rutilans HA7619-LM2]|jgi:hypothetical protein|nr:hypothetical protein [Stenomitos rutilans HA7619-LM2]
MAIQNVPKLVAKKVLKRYAYRFTSQPRHVQQAYMIALRRWAWVKPIWDEVYQELFPPDASAPEETAAIAARPPIALPTAAGVQTVDSPYPRYRCLQNDPLRCSQAQPLGTDGEKLAYCQEPCGFPTQLPERAELQGQRGIYRIEQWLGRRGLGRIYAAVQTGMNQPVLVKEYLLPKQYFNADQTWQTKQLFKTLAGLSLADGRSQDCRLLAPLEAIVDERSERCFIVLDGRGTAPTLNQYLTTGAMSEAQVRRVLHQVLQTLEFLYGQKFRLSAGQLQTGLVHGNLNLDSLLIGQTHVNPQLQTPTAASETDQDQDANFFIYLSDLALWERLFQPPLAKTTPPSVAQDLSAIGYIAFYLLTGKITTADGQPLDPMQDTHWQRADGHMPDRALKQFILRLLGWETPFESAEAARRVLQQLPIARPSIASELLATPEPTPKRHLSRWAIGLLSICGLGLLGWLLWSVLPKPQLSTANRVPSLNALRDVGGIPPGTFTYSTTADGIWSYVWQTTDLIQKGQTLQQRVSTAQPKLQLQLQTADSIDTAIDQVQAGTTNFAIVPLLHTLPDTLTAEPIAYDGLAVFVAFSYAKRTTGLPTQLHGQLDLEQLRQLYTGSINQWSAFSPSHLTVGLYAPENREAIEIFQRRVLQPSFDHPSSTSMHTIAQLPDFAVMRSVIQDFEAHQIGSIGFSSLSKVVGQCSVYPLALQQAPNAGQPIQVLGFAQGRSITPETDLCNEKGSYRLKPSLLRTGQYPLSYPLVVVYAKDNDRSTIGQKFAALLKTREGQHLLSQTGLVPLEEP